MGFEFHHRLFHRIMQTVYIQIMSNIILFFLTRRLVKGKENIPKQGALLIVSNHLSGADQFLLSASFNRKVVYMAKEELFRSRLIRCLAASFGAFPVRRGGIMDRQAVHLASQILESGQALVMFPEGMRSRKAQLKPAFPGSALIALHNNVPILPVGITGMEHIDVKGPLWHLIHHPRVTVNIGRPFHLPSVKNKRELNKAQLVELADYIMEHIAELLPPEYQGHYARDKD